MSTEIGAPGMFFFVFFRRFIAPGGLSWYNPFIGKRGVPVGKRRLTRLLAAWVLCWLCLQCAVPGAGVIPAARAASEGAQEKSEAEPVVLSALFMEDIAAGYAPNPEWEEKFAALFRSSGAKAGVFIVTRRGKPLLIYTQGNRDTHKNPVELTTTYHIASVTKMVTAIGFMQLYEQGMIGLDDPISGYLPMRVANPACPDRDITMRQVLSHTSSIKQTSGYLPDWENLKPGTKYFYRNLVPGQKYHYANLNGGLCGAMIEALSGRSVNAYMTEHVFYPLGIDAAYSPKLLIDQENIGSLMTRQGITTSNASRQLKAAEGYDDTCDPAIHTDRTAGALYISPAGLSKLMVMMVNGGVYEGVRILSEETIRLMEQDQSEIPGSSVAGKSDYGLFVAHHDLGGPVWYGHQGRYNGLTSDAFYQPETGLTFVMVVNGYNGKSNNGLANLAKHCMTYIDSWGMGTDDGF